LLGEEIINALKGSDIMGPASGHWNEKTRKQKELNRLGLDGIIRKTSGHVRGEHKASRAREKTRKASTHGQKLIGSAGSALKKSTLHEQPAEK